MFHICFFKKVGTLLAERLLYLPSVGYCLLLGWIVTKAEEMWLNSQSNVNGDRMDKRLRHDDHQIEHPAQTSETSIGVERRSQASDGGTCRVGWMRLILWVVVSVMIGRTRQRIPDWMSDWTLFHAVLETCPNSAKSNHKVEITFYLSFKISRDKERQRDGVCESQGNLSQFVCVSGGSVMDD